MYKFLVKAECKAKKHRLIKKGFVSIPSRMSQMLHLQRAPFEIHNIPYFILLYGAIELKSGFRLHTITRLPPRLNVYFIETSTACYCRDILRVSSRVLPDP